MNTPIHLCIVISVSRKNILEKMQAKIKLDPDKIWKEDAVVKTRAILIKHRLVWWKMAAGKKMKGLNSSSLLVAVSHSSLLFLVLKRLQAMDIKMQVNSPKDKPHVWRKGCRKMWVVPFFPSEYRVLLNLKKSNWDTFYFCDV